MFSDRYTGSRSDPSLVGEWIVPYPIRQVNSLEKAELVLAGKDKKMFLEFIRGMLAWRPEDRKTAKQLLEDPWLTTW